MADRQGKALENSSGSYDLWARASNIPVNNIIVSRFSSSVALPYDPHPPTL